MAEAETTESVDLDPKKITEEAVARLIQHIKMEYQPDGTVDPTSDGPVKGKAVWEAFQKAMLKKTIIYTDEVNKSHQELYDTETRIDVTDYIYYINETTLEGTPIKRAALDVQFVPILYKVLRWGIPLFQGHTFTLFLSGDNEGTYDDLNGSMCELRYERAYGGPLYDNHRVNMYTHRRNCHLELSGSRYYLVLHAMKETTLSVVTSESSRDVFSNGIYSDAEGDPSSMEQVLSWCGYMKIRKIILSKGLI